MAGEIDVPRHDSSPYPSTARAKLIFHSDVRTRFEWTAITHDTYLNFDKLDEKFCRQPQKITDYTDFTVAPKIVSTRTNERTNELGQLCQLIERGAGAAIIFRAQARRYDFIAAIKSE